MFKILFLINIIFYTISIQGFGQNNQVELGKVKWLRNFDEATSLSKKQNKPIFILFQEVPGCSTCKNFGINVMNHPLLVEIIETYFIPLAIFNNKGAHDAEILKKFNEPSWNNPVMRMVDAKGNNLMDRLSGQYDLRGVLTYLRKGMQHTGKLIPLWIQNFETEISATQTSDITLEMYCFWTGEKNLGSLNGVINTVPGYSNGREVVKVTYDANITSAEKILGEGKKTSCADAVHTNEKIISQKASTHNVKVKTESTFRPDNDLHYYLKQSKYASIPMTPMQATKVNSYLGFGKLPDELLSPGQLAFLQKKDGKPRYDKDIVKAWQL